MGKRKQIYKISYTLRNEKGFIIDYSKKFESFCQMYEFIRELRNSGNLVGKPIMGE